MAKRKKITKKKTMSCGDKMSSTCSPSSCIWFLGFIGAAIYNLSQAVGFWGGVVGLIKALVWPAFLVFNLMKYMGM